MWWSEDERYAGGLLVCTTQRGTTTTILPTPYLKG